MNRWILFGSMGLVLACGKGIETVDTAEKLPKCDTENNLGKTAFTKDKSIIWLCTATGWREEAGPSAIPSPSAAPTSLVESFWSFHLDSYSGQVNLGAESSLDTVAIGDVKLTRFYDGSANVLVSGYMSSSTSGSQTYTENFSHSLFLKSTTDEQEFILKFDSVANYRIRYKITLKTDPIFKASMDTNGNFGNNTDTTYSLSKVN